MAREPGARELTAREAYNEILPRYMQLRVDQVRAVYREHGSPMGPLTLFGSICEGGRMPRGHYAAQGTTAEAVSAVLAEQFNRTLEG